MTDFMRRRPLLSIILGFFVLVLLLSSFPIVPETIGRVAEVNVGFAGKVTQGQQLFRLDNSKQEAAVETAKRKIAEVEASVIVAQTDLALADGKIQEAKAALQQTVDELETKLFEGRCDASPQAHLEGEDFRSVDLITIVASCYDTLIGRSARRGITSRPSSSMERNQRSRSPESA